MAFLRSATPDDYFEPISGPQIVLRPPSMGDYSEWAELRAASRLHLTPWEPQWARDDLSHMMYRRRLRLYAKDARDDLGYAYFVTSAASHVIFGGITIMNIRRGVAQTASVGYWLGARHTGQGHMPEAVRMVLDHAFQHLRLNRVEAATMTANTASIRVLEKSGFVREGIARSFLKINGRWEDHIMFARLASDAQPVKAKTEAGL